MTSRRRRVLRGCGALFALGGTGGCSGLAGTTTESEPTRTPPSTFFWFRLRNTETDRRWVLATPAGLASVDPAQDDGYEDSHLFRAALNDDGVGRWQDAVRRSSLRADPSAHHWESIYEGNVAIGFSLTRSKTEWWLDEAFGSEPVVGAVPSRDAYERLESTVEKQ